jgi:hypothetical protein
LAAFTGLAVVPDFARFAGLGASISTTGSAAFALPTRTEPFPSIAGSRDVVPARTSRATAEDFTGREPFEPEPAPDSFFLLRTGADEPGTRDFDERAEEGLAIDHEA